MYVRLVWVHPYHVCGTVGVLWSDMLRRLIMYDQYAVMLVECREVMMKPERLQVIMKLLTGQDVIRFACLMYRAWWRA